MFTGIIDDIGTVDRATPGPDGIELRIRCTYDDLVPGESIAVSGVCLTVRECAAGWFTAAAVAPTVGRTSIGGWRSGTRVNLERAMRVGDRFGGHIVQGHVDDVALVRSVETGGDALLVELGVGARVAELMVPRGSVAVDGVSLTIQTMPAPDVIRIALVEFTRRKTTLGAMTAGMHVHIEADVVGKYVRRLVDGYVLERDPG